MSFKSFIGNPILEPSTINKWESLAVFNGCPIKIGDKYHLLYRSLGKTIIDNMEVNLSSIGIATSDNKTTFTNRKLFISPENHWEKFGCEDPRVCKMDGKYYIFYTAVSEYPAGVDSVKIAVAVSKDLKTIEEKHLVTPFNAKAMSFFPSKIDGKYCVIFTYGTETNESSIAIAYLDSIEDLWSADYWQKWMNNRQYRLLELDRLNTDRVEVGAPPIEIENGFLVIYSHIQNYYSNSRIFGIEAVLLDKDNPQKIIRRTKKPLMLPQEEYELKGMIPNVVFPSGALLENDNIYLYYGAADTTVAMAVSSLPNLRLELEPAANRQIKLTKYTGNPIIKPNPNSPWCARAVFNPTVFYHQGVFHIIFRAMSMDNTSTFGYASSSDGYNIDYLHPDPIYIPKFEFEAKKIANGNSGCEDPRVTLIGDRLYVVYTGYNGTVPPVIAMSSILLSDFLNHRFDLWTTPIVISDPSIDDKDGCFLPEKIGGKYVFFHRPGGKGMGIDFVDNLEFGQGISLKSDICISLNLNNWDSVKTGIAGVPVKTEKGWLVFYHAINRTDHYYRLGALLFDFENGPKIIGKIDNPLLEPEFDYERQGQVSNVVFPCGHIIVDDHIFIYYGCADTCIGVASAPINKLLDSINYID